MRQTSRAARRFSHPCCIAQAFVTGRPNTLSTLSTKHTLREIARNNRMLAQRFISFWLLHAKCFRFFYYTRKEVCRVCHRNAVLFMRQTSRAARRFSHPCCIAQAFVPPLLGCRLSRCVCLPLLGGYGTRPTPCRCESVADHTSLLPRGDCWPSEHSHCSLFKFHDVECSTQDSGARRGCSGSVSSQVFFFLEQTSFISGNRNLLYPKIPFFLSRTRVP
jgi:hypothetical protein